MNGISAANLSVKRGNKYILRDISWQIEPGDRWLVFGLNGCGKTTLLSILAGYQTGSEGALTILGETPTAENITALRSRIGWVSTSFFEEYITRENILDIVLAGKQGTLGLCDDDIADEDVRRAKRLLTELGLRKNMRYPYDLLSRGQKQKVLLARAAMSAGEVLILDEPCDGLDILAQEKVLYALAKRVREESPTVVYVTHHADEILPIFNKALLLKNGQIHSQGEIAQIFNGENLTDFWGIPTMVTQVGGHWAISLDMEGIAIDGSRERRERGTV